MMRRTRWSRWMRSRLLSGALAAALTPGLGAPAAFAFGEAGHLRPLAAAGVAGGVAALAGKTFDEELGISLEKLGDVARVAHGDFIVNLAELNRRLEVVRELQRAMERSPNVRFFLHDPEATSADEVWDSLAQLNKRAQAATAVDPDKPETPGFARLEPARFADVLYGTDPDSVRAQLAAAGLIGAPAPAGLPAAVAPPPKSAVLRGRVPHNGLTVREALPRVFPDVVDLERYLVSVEHPDDEEVQGGSGLVGLDDVVNEDDALVLTPLVGGGGGPLLPPSQESRPQPGGEVVEERLSPEERGTAVDLREPGGPVESVLGPDVHIPSSPAELREQILKDLPENLPADKRLAVNGILSQLAKPDLPYEGKEGEESEEAAYAEYVQTVGAPDYGLRAYRGAVVRKAAAQADRAGAQAPPEVIEGAEALMRWLPDDSGFEGQGLRRATALDLAMIGALHEVDEVRSILTRLFQEELRPDEALALITPQGVSRVEAEELVRQVRLYQELSEGEWSQVDAGLALLSASLTTTQVGTIRGLLARARRDLDSQGAITQLVALGIPTLDVGLARAMVDRATVITAMAGSTRLRSIAVTVFSKPRSPTMTFEEALKERLPAAYTEKRKGHTVPARDYIVYLQLKTGGERTIWDGDWTDRALQARDWLRVLKTPLSTGDVLVFYPLSRRIAGGSDALHATSGGGFLRGGLTVEDLRRIGRLWGIEVRIVRQPNFHGIQVVIEPQRDSTSLPGLKLMASEKETLEQLLDQLLIVGVDSRRKDMRQLPAGMWVDFVVLSEAKDPRLWERLVWAEAPRWGILTKPATASASVRYDKDGYQLLIPEERAEIDRVVADIVGQSPWREPEKASLRNLLAEVLRGTVTRATASRALSQTFYVPAAMATSYVNRAFAPVYFGLTDDERQLVRGALPDRPFSGVMVSLPDQELEFQEILARMLTRRLLPAGEWETVQRLALDALTVRGLTAKEARAALRLILVPSGSSDAEVGGPTGGAAGPAGKRVIRTIPDAGGNMVTVVLTDAAFAAMKSVAEVNPTGLGSLTEALRREANVGPTVYVRLVAESSAPVQAGPAAAQAPAQLVVAPDAARPEAETTSEVEVPNRTDAAEPVPFHTFVRQHEEFAPFGSWDGDRFVPAAGVAFSIVPRAVKVPHDTDVVILATPAARERAVIQPGAALRAVRRTPAAVTTWQADLDEQGGEAAERLNEAAKAESAKETPEWRLLREVGLGESVVDIIFQHVKAHSLRSIDELTRIPNIQVGGRMDAIRAALAGSVQPAMVAPAQGGAVGPKEFRADQLIADWISIFAWMAIHAVHGAAADGTRAWMTQHRQVTGLMSELADGTRTLENAAAALATTWNIEPERARAPLRAFAQAVQGDPVLIFDPHIADEHLRTAMRGLSVHQIIAFTDEVVGAKSIGPLRALATSEGLIELTLPPPGTALAFIRATGAGANVAEPEGSSGATPDADRPEEAPERRFEKRFEQILQAFLQETPGEPSAAFQKWADGEGGEMILRGPRDRSLDSRLDALLTLANALGIATEQRPTSNGTGRQEHVLRLDVAWYRRLVALAQPLSVSPEGESVIRGLDEVALSAVERAPALVYVGSEKDAKVFEGVGRPLTVVVLAPPPALPPGANTVYSYAGAVTRALGELGPGVGAGGQRPPPDAAGGRPDSATEEAVRRVFIPPSALPPETPEPVKRMLQSFQKEEPSG